MIQGPVAALKEGDWLRVGTIGTDLIPETWVRELEGYRLCVQEGNTGRFWALINGNPMGGNFKKVEVAKRKCEKMVKEKWCALPL